MGNGSRVGAAGSVWRHAGASGPPKLQQCPALPWLLEWPDGGGSSHAGTLPLIFALFAARVCRVSVSRGQKLKTEPRPPFSRSPRPSTRVPFACLHGLDFAITQRASMSACMPYGPLHQSFSVFFGRRKKKSLAAHGAQLGCVMSSKVAFLSWWSQLRGHLLNKQILKSLFS